MGILAGLSAVIIKNAAHLIQEMLISGFTSQYENYLYFIYPAVGILLAIVFYALYCATGYWTWNSRGVVCHFTQKMASSKRITSSLLLLRVLSQLVLVVQLGLKGLPFLPERLLVPI